MQQLQDNDVFGSARTKLKSSKLESELRMRRLSQGLSPRCNDVCLHCDIYIYIFINAPVTAAAKTCEGVARARMLCCCTIYPHAHVHVLNFDECIPSPMQIQLISLIMNYSYQHSPQPCTCVH